MEAPPIITNEALDAKKQDNSIELKLKSNKNIYYDISIYYLEDKLYFTGKSKFPNKEYAKGYSLEEIKRAKINKYFDSHENIKEVYDELNKLVNNYKDINEIKIFEKPNKLFMVFPVNMVKIKMFLFEINEISLNNEQIFENIFNKLKEMEDKLFEENTSLKRQINEIKEENKKLKEQISQKDIKIQSGEYLATFFFDNKNNYMYNSTGTRSFTQRIYFNEVYEKIPNVMVSINGLDSDKDRNLRINVFAEHIDTSGFNLKIITWDNTALYRVKSSWIAFV